MHMRITRHLIVAGLAALLAIPAIPAGVAVADTGTAVSSTAVTSSANPSNFGQPVTFTATVDSVPSGGVPTPTGTVQFYDGTTSLGSATLVAGVASLLPISSLVAGSHSITADYLGDSTYDVSTSAPVAEVW